MSVHRVLVISHAYLDPARRGKLRALAARDLDVTVGVPHRWIEPGLGRPLEARWERQANIELVPVPARRIGAAETLVFRGRELRALLRDKRPDIVQVEAEASTPVAAQVVRAARRANIPAVLGVQTNAEPALSWRERWRSKRTLARARGVVAGSGAAADLVRRTRPDAPLAVIPQLGVAVATTPEHAYHEGLAIGYIGRLVPEKGIDTLLEALAQNRTERWHLTVAGEGPERERLEQLASEHRVAPRIRWTGALPPDHIARLWPELDVLVLPSRSLPGWSEPTAHVLMEAMAHEVAVIGTDSGVIPEVIGDAGVIVPADDALALGTALRRLVPTAERQPLIQAARARVMQRFSDDAIAERTLEFWREIVR
jgi:glycosyltransferase involved in cell wall biosynthesis